MTSTAGKPQTNDKPGKAVDFSDTRVAYSAFSTPDLLRGVFVFNMCSIRALVNHADAVLRNSYAVFGRTLTEAVIRQTFFKHFCAGETATTIKPRVEALRRAGVAGILDYAAEAVREATQQDRCTKIDISAGIDLSISL